MTSFALDAARIGLLEALSSGAVRRLYDKFDALSPSAASAPPVVRFAVVQAACRFTLIRLNRARSYVHISFDPSMRLAVRVRSFVDAAVPDEPAKYRIEDEDKYVSYVLESARQMIGKHCGSTWEFAAEAKPLLNTIRDMIGDGTIEGLRIEVRRRLDAEAFRCAKEGDVRKAVQDFCQGRKAVHLEELRRWAFEHVCTDVLTKDDFSAVYDELVVRDVIDS